MSNPLVSIVTITRNRGNMLKRCIESTLSQSYTNIEHIVVDGASDDNTDDVVSSFQDARLRFFKLDYNWQLHATAEFAYSKCNGKYITFLDSDDEYLPSKIEKQVSLIESLPDDFGFVYCWMTYYDTSNNNSIIKVHKPELRGDVKDEVIGQPIISGSPTLLFHMDFFRELGGWKSREEVGIGSDWELCARACQSKKVDYVAESLVNVYINHGSVRQSETTKYYDDICHRRIKFHTYFLSQFKNNFARRPRQLVYHYQGLALSYYQLKDYKNSFVYFFKALCSNPRVFVKNLFARV